MRAAAGAALPPLRSLPAWRRLAKRLRSATPLRLLDPVLAVVFPARCAACGSYVGEPSRTPLCERCWRALPRHRGALCGCGTPLPRGADAICGRCRRGLNTLTAAACLGPYEGSLRVLIHELKYRGKRRVADHVAVLLAHDATVQAVLSPGAVLVPVPLHPRRQRERGYNQSTLLAQAVASRHRLKLVRALRRKRHTAAQTGLSAAQRRANVRGAFAVRRPATMRGRTVVLVDDVVTTGATAQACARALLSAGAAEVRLLTVARA